MWYNLWSDEYIAGWKSCSILWRVCVGLAPPSGFSLESLVRLGNLLKMTGQHPRITFNIVELWSFHIKQIDLLLRVKLKEI